MVTLEESFVGAVLAVFAIYLCQILFYSRKKTITTTVTKIVKENENYLRLLTCLNHAGKEVCLQIMFANGLSKSKAKLYQTLLIFQSTFKDLKRRKIIRDDQWNILYPQNCQTDYEEFDITLIYLIIRNCCSLPAPLGGWNIENLQKHDSSISAFLMKLKAFRNKLSHYGSIPISDVDFQKDWNELMQILAGLKYDISKISDLKTCSLDTSKEYHNTLVRSQLELCFDIVAKNSQQIKLLQNFEIERKGTTDKLKHVQSSQDTIARKMQTMTKEMDQAKLELENLVKDKLTTNVKLLSIYDKISELERKFAKPIYTQRFSICEVQQRKSYQSDSQQEEATTGFQLSKPIDHLISQRTQHSYLSEINLSNNTTLTVESFQNLSKKICNTKHFIYDKLVLMDCNLNDMHVKALSKAIPRLSDLDLSWNTSITPNGWKSLADSVSGHECSRFKTFSVAGCNISDQHIMAMSPILPQLHTIDLSYNSSITIAGFKCLSNAIMESPSVEIKEMNISNCNLTDKSLISMAESFVFIEQVVLSSNPSIGKDGYQYLCDVISHSSNRILNRIDFEGCKLNDERIKAISPMLPLLKTVDFSGNRSITARGWGHLSTAIQCNGYSELQKIYLSQSNFGDGDFKELSTLFIALNSVEISDSDISLDGLSHFVDHITTSSSCKLTEFKLHNCHLTVEHLLAMVPLFRTTINPIISDLPEVSEEDYQRIIDYFKENAADFLHKLSFRDMNISDSCLKAVAPVVTSMTKLDIAGNTQISGEGLSHLARAILQQQPFTLNSLDVSYCNISDNHMQVLAKVVPHTSELLLSGNTGITPVVFTNICRSILSSNLFILKALDLSYCNLTDDHLQILANLLPVIEKINLQGNTGITLAGWKYFSNSITSWSKILLRELSIVDCNITSAVLPLFLNPGCILRKLNLSWNKTLEPATSFSVQQTCLERIELLDCNLVETFLIHFGTFLSSLKEVFLDLNTGMTDLSLKQFADAICESESKLEYVSLENCNLRNEHIIAFSHAVPFIKGVNLSSNKAVTKRGWEYLANSIINANSIHLDTLHMEECNLKGYSLQVILKIVPSIVCLNLANNTFIMPEDFSVLSEIFECAIFSRFSRLELDGCNLTDTHLKALAPSLQYIKNLAIHNNKAITKEGLKHILNSVKASDISLLESIFVSPSRLTEIDLLELVPTPKAVTICLCPPEIKFSTEMRLENLDFWFENSVFNKDQLEVVKRFTTESNIIIVSDMSLTNKFHEVIPAIGNGKIPYLRELILSNCSLVDMDIESVATISSQLQILDLSDNKFITSTGLNYISVAIQNSKCNRLEQLNLRSCNITDAHLHKLECLSMFLKGIDLSGNKHTSPSGWRRFTENVHSNDVITLEKLILNNCNITKSHLDAMLELIVKLKDLSLVNNHTLTPSCYSYLSKILSTAEQSSLARLDFRQESMGDFHIQRIESVIPTLQTLNLDGVQRLSPSSYKSIASVLKNHRRYLEVLDLSSASVTNADMVYIGEISSACKRVILDKNKGITEIGFKNFSKAFKKTTADELEELKIDNCSLTDRKMRALNNVFPVLKTLTLDQNRFSPVVLYELSNSLSSQQSRLQNLSLRNCNITREHLEAMREGMPTLRYLDLSENPTLTAVDYVYLSNSICSTTCNMKRVDLAQCNIGDDHLQGMVELIANLKVIDLSRNKAITAAGLKYICSHIATMSNVKLEEIYFEDCNISRSHLTEMKPMMSLLKYITFKDNPRLLYNESLATNPKNIGNLQNDQKTRDNLDPVGDNLDHIFDGISDRISFKGCRLTDSQLINISSFILNIKILDLTEQKRITSSSLNSIANTISKQTNGKLKELRLCEFDDGESIAASISTIVPLLKVLDVSKSKSLTPNALKRLIEACVNSDSLKLETLKLQEMNLNAFHLDPLNDLIPLLKELDISYNKTLSPSCYETIGKAITTAENLQLKILHVKGCNLQAKHLKEISHFACFISNLILDENQLLTESSLKQFADSIRSPVKPSLLEKISFAECRFNDKHLKAFSVMCPYVNEIDVGRNKWILKAGIKHISDALVGTTSKLETIRFHNCNINQTHFEGMKGIIDNVKNLDLHHNRKWTINDLKSLSKLISTSTTTSLQSIDLSDCNLKDCHLNVISSIASNVQELNISKNRCVTPKGFEPLVNVCISDRSKLRTLNIAKCNLNSDHLQLMAKMIPFLSTVNLSKNRMLTRYGLDYIAESVCRHGNDSKLVSINLEDCNLDDFCLNSIRSMMSSLKTIILNRNKGISLDGFMDFMTVFEDSNLGDSAGTTKEKIEIQIKDCFVENGDLIDQLDKFKAFANIQIT